MPAEQKPTIRFGGLREIVKSGKLCAKDVLNFARKNHASPEFIGWLIRFDLEAHKKRAEADKIRREKLSKA